MADDTRDLGEQALAKLVKDVAETTSPPKEEAREEVIESVEPTPEQALEIRAQKKARLAQVLTRGITNEKLQNVLDASVPTGRAGKYVRDSDEDIVRYKNLGFTFDYKEGASGLHGTGDGRIRVGDLVLMTISLEDQGLLREIREERVKSKLEEGRKDYTRQAAPYAERGGPLPFDESTKH